jgi:hypothetical protein
MPDNANTDLESPPLDHEDWNIVFRAYVKFPNLAFILAQHLHGASRLIEQGPESAAEAMVGLDRAVACLMPYTRYHNIGRTVYMLAVAGNLSTEQEDTLRKLGLLK